MAKAGVNVKGMRVDGGLTRSRVLMQTQADLLGIRLEASENPQVTAIGVGLMAGLGAGIWSWPDGLPVSPPDGSEYQPNEKIACSLRERHAPFIRVCREAVQRDRFLQAE